MSQEKLDKFIEELRKNREQKVADLIDVISELNPEAMLADGFNDSIMGYDKDGRVIYSVENIIHTLIERDGMSREEAVEFYDFNIECAFVGDYTPIYMYEE
tara:strand:- start:286 stop:588 length:303 start_codon:yes stop_codon:yes gene_type:complete